MRRVTLGRTGIETSCLGFGCASLGSRVAEAPGLAALAAAHDAGVTWFDLAPLYGGGRAEEIAGRFLKGRPRDAVQICSKVGLVPSGAGGGARAQLKAALMPLARRAVAAVPALRSALRGAGAQAAQNLPLTPEALRGSIETSLRRLGTDHLDLYALHDASPEAVARDEVRRTLEDIVASGKARAVAVAAGMPAADAALAAGAPYGAVQVGLAAPGAAFDLPARAAAAGAGCLVHSVFGIAGSLAGLKARAAADPALAARLVAESGEPGVEAAVSRLLLARGLALNPQGVVLVSMFSERSRRANLALADAAPGDAAALDRLLG
jgi:aryl-alcohol dehydrogenase-like predicted oxidoreductase